MLIELYPFGYIFSAKQKAQTLKTEIDWMVYELYGLTEDEIGIVEGN
jgi:hypothetical protein